jgi:uncharacterized DUF497 family protein
MIGWDETKRQANIAKHGIDFAMAADFQWDGAVVFEDTRFDYGEVRLVAIGQIGTKVFTMVFTEATAGLRIISLRPAHRKERAVHEKAQP